MRYRTYRGPGLTPLLAIIGVNVVLSIITTITRLIDTAIYRDLISYLGLMPAAVLSRPWTIVTSMFVHGGLWHVMANMLALFFFGRYLSALVGINRFLIVYFIGGIIGSIFYVVLAPPISIAVGASGAIFALAGALVVMRPKTRVFIIPIPVPLPLWVAVIGGFLVLSLFPNVAWQAHLGGLVVGLISGYFFRKRERFYF